MSLNFTRRKVSLATLLLLAFGFMLPIGMMSQQSVARQWNETTLSCIRKYSARPTVHARNLFHSSVVMYDAWAVYDDNAAPFFLGNTWGAFNCPFDGIPMPADGDLVAAQEKAISYAMFRHLLNRYTIFAPAVNLPLIQGYINNQMAALGYNPSITSTDYSDGDPAKLGNYIAAKMQEFALQDGSNQQGNYANLYYQPIQGQLEAYLPGNPTCIDPNRWQALVLLQCFDQSTGLPVECPPGTGAAAVGPEWGNVVPFCLDPNTQSEVLSREGHDWRVYLDPGAPPLLDTTNALGLDDSFFKWGYVANIIWHSFHNNDDGVMIDASPNAVGGLNFTSPDQLPTTFEEYKAFYNLMEGGVDDPGHTVNPVTGMPYETQMVPRKDFTRVLSQYWADGPNSETPPGHWFKLFNDVADHPMLEKRWMGEGDVLSNLEWDVRGYFALGGGIHDAAIACWGAKGYYDYTRPIMAIRYMADKGQCTDPLLPHYHPAGLPLIPGYIELVEEGDPLAGASNEHVNKIKIYSWRGPVAATGQDGAGWLLGENWWTYQTAGFVTPPFPGYYSGHSTYSRTGAEIMTLITGDEYFPGGMAEYDAPAGTYLLADNGPSVEVKLQWATYRDASDQCSLSRIYGGLHPPQDDIPGRKVGLVVGPCAFYSANSLNEGGIPRVTSIAFSDELITDADAGNTMTVTITFDETMDMTIDPTINFYDIDAGSSLVAGNGTWLDGMTFEQEYTVIDENVTYGNIDLQIVDAQDPDGNHNIPAISDPIMLDTENPMVSSFSNDNNIIVVNDEAVAIATPFQITLSYTEPMDINTLPSFTYASDNAAGTFILNEAASSWSEDAMMFTAVFDLADNNEEWSNVDMQTVSATDAVGNEQIMYMEENIAIIDTKNPSVSLGASNTELINDDYTGTPYTWTFTYDEPMNTDVAPIISFSGGDASTTLLWDGDNSGWDGNNYIATYYTVDDNVTLNVNSVMTVTAQDLFGNSQVEYSSPFGLLIDTENPVVNTLTTTDNLVADNNIGGTFNVAITFSEAMNTAVTPVVTYANGNPLANTLVSSAGSWSGNTYTISYTVGNSDEEIWNISVLSVNAEDANGNMQTLDYNSGALFSIDTHNPTIVAATANTYNVTSANVDTGFEITVVYDEPMDSFTVPMITFPLENPTSLTFDVDNSEWISESTYKARYSVANTLASLPNIDVAISNDATDIAGNESNESALANFFSINVIVSVIEMDNNNPLMIYPNPVESGNMLYLEWNSVPTELSVSIYNSVGELVLAQDQSTASEKRIALNTSGLASGMYVIQVNADGGRAVFNLSVTK